MVIDLLSWRGTSGIERRQLMSAVLGSIQILHFGTLIRLQYLARPKNILKPDFIAANCACLICSPVKIPYSRPIVPPNCRFIIAAHQTDGTLLLDTMACGHWYHLP